MKKLFLFNIILVALMMVPPAIFAQTGETPDGSFSTYEIISSVVAAASIIANLFQFNLFGGLSKALGISETKVKQAREWFANARNYVADGNLSSEEIKHLVETGQAIFKE